jgi:hypothetical protein
MADRISVPSRLMFSAKRSAITDDVAGDIDRRLSLWAIGAGPPLPANILAPW